jgi:hypothetical protein
LDKIERMMQLFRGYRGAHGTHGRTTSSRGVKKEIKKTASTVREPVTRETWERHISGDRPLGIIAINEENRCYWGCIDVDKYDIDHAEVVSRLESSPLVCCRTKSGGVHAFLFVAEAVPAEEMRVTLQSLAASLGWGDCEIFPKQTQVLTERGDLGNWLNMPYLSGDNTERYGIKKSGLPMSLSEFLTYAESKVQKSLDAVGVSMTKELEDGPPCLQHLTTNGFPEGTRNNGLFALGIYCKKKYGENWRSHLEELNQKYMQPPLTSDEVVAVQRSLEKKDYNYSCREQPLCNFCESAVCRTRKFGVGSSGLYPEISGLSKLETDPPIWFLDIEGKRVELETKELQEYRNFQKVCMEQLTVFYMPLSAPVWASMVGSAMEHAVIIEAPREMSISGYFMELVESFCRDRHRGQRWQDVHDGRPYYDEETNAHWFRLRDLTQHLEREGFRHWGRNKIGKELKQIGGQGGRNIEGRFVNMFYIDDDAFEPDAEVTTPEPPREPL